MLDSGSACGLVGLCQVLTLGLVSCGRGGESFGLWHVQQVMREQIPVGTGGPEVGGHHAGQTD